MKVIKLSTSGSATAVTIDDTRVLEETQRLVGGYVEKISITENVDLVFNEEGEFISGHKANRIAGRLLRHFDVHLMPGDYIAGDAVLVGVDGPSWTSVPDSAAGTLEFLGFSVAQESA